MSSSLASASESALSDFSLDSAMTLYLQGICKMWFVSHGLQLFIEAVCRCRRLQYDTGVQWRLLEQSTYSVLCGRCHPSFNQSAAVINHCSIDHFLVYLQRTIYFLTFNRMNSPVLKALQHTIIVILSS